MAPQLVVKKKKFGARATGGGAGAGKKVTPLRPFRTPKMAPCQNGCPMGNDIRRALTLVAQSEKYNRTHEQSLEQAWYVFTNTNPMPSTLGRVCPHPCEKECNRSHKDGAVNINQFERSVGDYGVDQGLKLTKLTDEKRPEKVAVVGSGPAGISCAYQLARRGYQVTIFEAFPKAGGMLRYGIPPYRLPRNILDAEIQRVVDLGVELRTSTVIGKDITLEDLQTQYQAVYVGIGAHKGRELGAPGEDAENILTGVEFLNRINSGEKITVGNDVVVVGGGDSAIDAARVCKRLGATTTIVYRRTKAEMPAIAHEIDEAEAEGIGFEFLSVPVQAVKNGNTAVKLVCQRMELGEPDASGRRRPVPIPGATYERSVSTLISAISQEPDFVGDLGSIGNPKDWIKVDGQWKTAKPHVLAGGDAVKLGLVTVAIGQGRFAAEIIDADLRGEQPKTVDGMPVIRHDKIKLDWYPPATRGEQTFVPVAERFASSDAMSLETALGVPQAKILDESKRCFSCGMCMDCDNCWMYCQDQVVVKLDKSLPIGEHYTYKLELCQGCEKCAEECPCGYIAMR
jgi:NADPH-dependent glutamate synthase beta subunit-like oxidoreductase/Pyruvate/2-oxoacid:ferredoxin oxidoreductase delta subunit